MLPNGVEILFRQLDTPVASWSKPGIRWVVEYWRKEMGFPIAQAWVGIGYVPYIHWLHVMEGHRRRGVGTRLLTAIKDRWPGVEYDAVSEAGEMFVDGLTEKGVIADPALDGAADVS